MNISEEIIRLAKQLHASGACPGHGGNISVKETTNTFYCTPTCRNKSTIIAGELAYLSDKTGVVERLSGGKESMEFIHLHYGIYQKYPKIGAIIHAHPVELMAFAINGLDIEARCVPESYIELKDKIPCTKNYETPGTKELLESVLSLLNEYPSIIMKQHGLLLVGKDLHHAIDLYEESIALATAVSNALLLRRNLGLDSIVPIIEKGKLQELDKFRKE